MASPSEPAVMATDNLRSPSPPHSLELGADPPVNLRNEVVRFARGEGNVLRHTKANFVGNDKLARVQFPNSSEITRESIYGKHYPTSSLQFAIVQSLASGRTHGDV